MATKYTKELLEPIVKECESITEVLKKLGLKPAGGTHTNISKRIKEYKLDTSHFKTGAQGKKFGPKRPLAKYLSNEFSIKSDSLKKRLILEGVLPAVCNHCKNDKWMGQDIPLELHHKDCDHYNNGLENLEILCPNCHDLEHKKLNNNRKKTERNKRLSEWHIKNTTPRPQRRKVKRPPKDQLFKEVEEFGYSATGRKYGVSDNAIRKWLK